jgi:uncharacterized membrane protein
MNAPQTTRELSVIDDSNRDAVVDWLAERSQFHSWFTSLIVGSFVVLTVFGNRPGFGSISEVFLAVSLSLMLLSLLCNLVCVWSIPSWKYRVKTAILSDATAMRRELAITAWIGVISFVSALTIGFIGNLPH